MKYMINAAITSTATGTNIVPMILYTISKLNGDNDILFRRSSSNRIIVSIYDNILTLDM